MQNEITTFSLPVRSAELYPPPFEKNRATKLFLAIENLENHFKFYKFITNNYFFK